MPKKRNGLICSTPLLLAALASAASPAYAQSTAAPGPFTPACAARDLRALAAIEQFGEIEEMPAAWLGDAGLRFLDARMLCLAGNEGSGIALYDRIIAGDARLSASLRIQ